MSLSLAFQLRVEERGEDRIVVSVWLAPTGDTPARIEGVALQLVARNGEALGVRMLLPIAGALSQAMRFTVELKVPSGAIPLGSKVVGTAWDGPAQRETSIPTDPFTAFETHMCARRRVLPPDRADAPDLERLLPEERSRIAADYPWVDEPRVPPPPVAGLTVVDTEDDEDLDDLVDDLGLDPDSADWLKELLHEDEAG